MSITVHLYYKGENGNALKFVEEMETRGIANQIREEPGNLKYEYFQSLNDSQTILLVDSWQNQEALDIHHVSNMMNEIMRLRNKYNLHVKAERFVPDNFSLNDKKYIKE